MNYDGSDHVILSQNNGRLNDPESIIIKGDYLFWMDRNSLMRVNTKFYFMLSGRISRNIGKIFFDLTLATPVKIPIFMFLMPRLIARASQPGGNMTSFTLHFSRLT